MNVWRTQRTFLYSPTRPTHAPREHGRLRGLVQFSPALLLLGAWGLFLGLVPAATAQPQDESTLRAAFVFNLTKYVEWPHAPHELVIGFIGDSAMGSTLRTMLDGKKSNDATIKVTLLKVDDNFDACDLLYVSFTSSAKSRAVLDKAADLSILTVGETESFTSNGGMVGLVRYGDRIKIEVNLELVQSCHLKISSRLLNLATIVKTERRRG